MNTYLLSLIFLVLSFFVSENHGQSETSETATISGIIELAPKPASRSAGIYGRGRAAQNRQTSTESSRQIAIWITSENPGINTRPERPVLNQVDLQFVPQIIMVPVGSDVRILNSDPVYHNVFSLSRTKRFDVGRRPKGDYLDVVFNREGIVDVFCDIHSNMHAVIIVMPQQTRDWMTIKSGDQFQVNLPEGDYTLHIYVGGYEKSEQRISVSEGMNKNLGTIRLES